MAEVKEGIPSLRALVARAEHLFRSAIMGEALGVAAFTAGFLCLLMSPRRQWASGAYSLAAVAILSGAFRLGAKRWRRSAGVGQATAGAVLGLVGLTVAFIAAAIPE